jgi:hypothetical protein
LTPYRQFLALLALAGSTPAGKKHQCPGHGLVGEHSAALSVTEGDGGRVLVHCFAGCGVMDILGGFRLPYAALTELLPVDPCRWYESVLCGLRFPPPRVDRGGGAGWVAIEIVEHPYGHPSPFAWKVRERNAAGAKRIYWQSLNPRGERLDGLLGRSEADLPLYHIGEIRMAVAAGELVVLVESESSVDALNAAGLYSTTWPGGASSPPSDRLAAELAQANVLLVPDHDHAGLECAERIVRTLPHARVQLGEPGEDARDVLARRGQEWFR